jgi:hypothetical protein
MAAYATFTKRDGQWVIRAPKGRARPGQSIEVSKRDGSLVTEIVAAILETVDGFDYCSIRPSQRRRSPPRPGGVSGDATRRRYRNKYGWDGVVGSESYYSSGLYDEES